MTNQHRMHFASVFLIGGALLTQAIPAAGQQEGMSMPAGSADQAMHMAEHSMSGSMDSIMMRHMELSPTRPATKADSAKALGVVKELRSAPVATKADCDKIGGQFEPNVFGWMVHANVFAGNDLGTIFADHH